MPYTDKQKQREYQRQWVANRRFMWLQSNGPCKMCGSWNDLEIDHIDRAQKITHRVWSWSKVRLTKELSKCQVLCHDCHRAKSVIDGDQLPPASCGRIGMYQLGCRCVDCRQAKRLSRK